MIDRDGMPHPEPRTDNPVSRFRDDGGQEWMIDRNLQLSFFIPKTLLTLNPESDAWHADLHFNQRLPGPIYHPVDRLQGRVYELEMDFL